MVLYYLQDFMSLLNSPVFALAVGCGLTDLRLEYRKVTARVTGR